MHSNIIIERDFNIPYSTVQQWVDHQTKNKEENIKLHIMSYGTRVHTHTHTHTEHSIQQQVVTKQVLINLGRF